MAVVEGNYGKGSPWSTLTLGPSRQMCQKGSATLDRSLLKSKSCQQELACHYLQVRGRVSLVVLVMGQLMKSTKIYRDVSLMWRCFIVTIF